jgi:hypothetical protein
MTPEMEQAHARVDELRRDWELAEERLLMLARSEPEGSPAVSGVFARTSSLYGQWMQAAVSLARAEAIIAQIVEDRERGHAR